MQPRLLFLLLAVTPLASAVLTLKGVQTAQACAAEDLKHRAQVQNKLAGVCEDLCKEIGAYPKCAQCPAFVPPDATPGVLTWEELLEHMDNLVAWGQETIKGWHKQASALQVKPALAAMAVKQSEGTTACAAEDLKHRSLFQNKLAGVCEELCKEIGAYPKCAQCPAFVPPDATPGVLTWEELLEHMDNLVAWGQETIKGWHKQASALQKGAHATSAGEAACSSEDLKHRAQVQNKLAGVCEDLCKEIGAYPKCAQCPAFVPPDSTPGVLTWEELLEHMDNLVAWGQETIKGWHKQASALQVKPALAAMAVKQSEGTTACAAEDLKHRSLFQNKLAGVCEELCKEIGAYPKCAQCPAFVPPDSTPGVLTWEELLEHMDNLVAWGQETIKGWHKQASALQKGTHVASAGEAACSTEDVKRRAQLQNKLAGVCEELCKEIGAYPKCAQCPAFVPPDATPGVLTWEELLEHMDNLVAWGQETIKGWHKQASALL